MSDRESFQAGMEAGLAWLTDQAAEQLREEQLYALGRNVGLVYNDPGDLLHEDANADHAADAYAALTGDRDCCSRAKVREFWARILPGRIDDYDQAFYIGFLTAVAVEV
jgi:hypothetical protein